MADGGPGHKRHFLLGHAPSPELHLLPRVPRFAHALHGEAWRVSEAETEGLAHILERGQEEHTVVCAGGREKHQEMRMGQEAGVSGRHPKPGRPQHPGSSLRPQDRAPPRKTTATTGVYTSACVTVTYKAMGRETWGARDF